MKKCYGELGFATVQAFPSGNYIYEWNTSPISIYNSINDFVNKNFSFNPHNMFICKSKNLLSKYYSVVFAWLKKCEDLFGFDNLSGYGQTRIYGFLAERFMSYWFQNNAQYKTMPIIFYDIKKDLN